MAKIREIDPRQMSFELFLSEDVGLLEEDDEAFLIESEKEIDISEEVVEPKLAEIDETVYRSKLREGIEIGEGIFSPHSGNCLNYIEAPFSPFCEAEIRELEKMEKKNLKRIVSSMRLTPECIAQKVSTQYHKRVYSEISFQVALSKISVNLKEKDQEFIAKKTEEIRECFIELLTSMRY